jgi:hypothetical protein
MAMTFTKKEHDMDREYEVIELGVVSADTRGGAMIVTDDDEGGFKPSLGLVAD